MVSLTRIYTRTGDKGKTSLGDGTRVQKHDPWIEMIGAVDEVNAVIGLARVSVPQDIDAALKRIQNDLFDLGADLCCPETHEHTSDKQPLRMQGKHVKRLEQELDHMNHVLKPLTSFVLPGGTPASASLHFARTVARRAERLFSAYGSLLPLNPYILTYINRLSDYLFVMARYANDHGKLDVLWEPGENILSSSL